MITWKTQSSFFSVNILLSEVLVWSQIQDNKKLIATSAAFLLILIKTF